MMLRPIGPVIAGVAESPVTAAVVDLAAREAVARGAPLILVHARSAPAGAGAASGALEAALARVRRTRPGCAATAEVVRGDPVDVLAARSATASALVLGHAGHGRRRGGPRRRSVTLRVLGRAESPVIVCGRGGGGAARGSPPVLVGAGGTPAAETALEFGFVEAALRGAPLLAMHWHGADATEAADAFLDLLEVWSGKYPDVPVDLAVRHGLDPVIVLAAASHSAGLAVVDAAREPAGTRGALSRSALAAFLDRAGCPVAVVPPNGPPAPGPAGGCHPVPT